jgi:hypothetical protein
VNERGHSARSSTLRALESEGAGGDANTVVVRPWDALARRDRYHRGPFPRTSVAAICVCTRLFALVVERVGPDMVRMSVWFN